MSKPSNLELKKKKSIEKRIKKLSKNVNTKKSRSESQLTMAMRRFRKSKIGIIGLAIIIVFFAVGLLATPVALDIGYRNNEVFTLKWDGLPPFNPSSYMYNTLFTSNNMSNFDTPYSPNYQPPGTYTGWEQVTFPNGTIGREKATFSNYLGTNADGQDLYSRLVMGARISIFVSVVGTMIAAIIGIFIGMLAGFYGGRVDELLMRFTDIFLNLPFLLIIILAITVFQQNTELFNFLTQLSLSDEAYIFTLVLGLGVFGWTGIARLVRAQIFQIKAMDYVEAATALGTPSSRIMIRHIFPNILVSLTVVLSINMGGNIVAEAAISFLLPIATNLSSWGVEISNGIKQYAAWWGVIFPGICITLAVLGFNLLGDAINEAFDPRSK